MGINFLVKLLQGGAIFIDLNAICNIDGASFVSNTAFSVSRAAKDLESCAQTCYIPASHFELIVGCKFPAERRSDPQRRDPDCQIRQLHQQFCRQRMYTSSHKAALSTCYIPGPHFELIAGCKNSPILRSRVEPFSSKELPTSTAQRFSTTLQIMGRLSMCRKAAFPLF